MRKIILLILMLMFTSFAFAAESDNVKDYNEEYNVATIKNCDLDLFGLCLNEGEVIGQARLKTPHNYLVGAGYQKVAEFDMWAYEDYNEALRSFTFIDMKTEEEVVREIDLKYLTLEEVEVQDYYPECVDQELTNGTILVVCQDILNGSHIEVRKVWKDIISGDIESNEYMTVGVFTEVQIGDHIDWIPTIYGVQIEEWAEWTQTLNAGLVSYYKLNESSGDVIDSLGTNDGTNNGATRGVTGIIGDAYSFDGINDYVSIPDNPSWDVGTDLSVFQWVKTSNANNNLYSTNRWLHTSERLWAITGGTTGGIRVLTGTGTTIKQQYVSAINISDNDWHYIGFTFDNGVLKLYSDGQEVTGANLTKVTDAAISSIDNSALPVGIGARDVSGTPTLFYEAVIDEIGIWNRTLTAAEVTQLYNNGSGITWTNVFGTPPSVTLTSPVDTANLTSSNIEFISTVTDDVQVTNVTLYLDGVANETNSSGFNGTYIFNKVVSEGVHNWSILAFDNQSFSNQSQTWTFNYTEIPIDIQLITPSDLSTFETPEVNTTCTGARAGGIVELNLTINGVTNYTVTNSTANENLTLSIIQNFSEGQYNWSCSARNNGIAASSSNRTFTVNYSTPDVFLLDPANFSTFLDTIVNFTFNASDTNGIKNVTLLINGIVNQTNTSGFEGNYTYSVPLGDGASNWTAIAYSDLDKLGTTETRIVNIHSTSPDINISAPNGTIDYILIGDNETLEYNISEPGENSSHFSQCWHNYYNTVDSFSNISSSLDDWFDGDFNTTSRASGNFSVLDDSNELIMVNTGIVGTCSAPYYNYLTINVSTCSSTNGVKTIEAFYNNVLDDFWQSFSCDGNTLLNQSYPTFATCAFSPGEIIINKTYLDCAGTELNFTYISDRNNITVFAEDIFGLIGNDTSTWDYKVVEINQTFSNETLEGSTEDFEAIVNIGSTQSVSVVSLWYEGTVGIGSIQDYGDNQKISIDNFIVPDVSGETNSTFNWVITFSDATSVNLSTQTQLVRNIFVDNCSNYTNQILNISQVDEELQTALANGTIEVAITLLSVDRTQEILSLSGIFQNENPLGICINENLTGSIFSLDALIKYSADAYAIEYYNIQDVELSDTSDILDVILYSLNETDSTEFQLTFTGSDFLPVEGALVFVERQYVAENAFKTVELPKTDSNGQTVLHLVRNDIIYNIRIIKDDNLLGNFQNIIAFCEDFTIGQCTLNLNSLENVSTIANYDETIGITYTNEPTYDEVTNDVSFNFVATDGSTKVVTMTVERRDVFGNNSICQNTVISSSGTTTCDIGVNLSETTLFTTISIDGEELLTSSTIVDDVTYGDVGYLVWFLMSIALVLLFASSKNGVIISLLVGYAGAVSLALIKGSLIGIGSAGIWLITLTVLSIWQINKRRRS